MVNKPHKSLKQKIFDIAHKEGLSDIGFTNPKLVTLDLRYTNIKGGRPDGDETKVIHSTTFDQCAKLTNLYIDSASLLNEKEIATDAFIQNTTYYIYFKF